MEVEKNCVWLNVLKVSNRNCSENFSVNLKFL